MNMKASVAVAVLALSSVGISACASSASKVGAAAAAPTSVAGSVSSAPVSVASTSGPAMSATTATPSSPANPTDPTDPANPANPTAPRLRAPIRTDIPGAAMLLMADLAPSWSGNWRQFGGPPIPGSQMVDPDGCDPVPRPQYADPGYQRNPAWVAMQSMSWAGSDYSEVGEEVVTYTTATAAAADFEKHHGWVANCAATFQWTDKPAKYSISNVQPNGVAGAYAIRVAMDPPDQPASTAGSQGVVYTAVILRGNSLAFVTVSEADPKGSTPQDVVLTAFQHDLQVAAAKLSTVYAPTR